jgi:hypothetical protein
LQFATRSRNRAATSRPSHSGAQLAACAMRHILQVFVDAAVMRDVRPRAAAGVTAARV